MKWVIYRGGSDSVFVPFDTTATVGVHAPNGEPVQVPDGIAGHKAGAWRPATLEEAPPGSHGFTVGGWPLRPLLDADGNPQLTEAGTVAFETRDPGSGLLAQEGVFESSKKPTGGEQS